MASKDTEVRRLAILKSTTASISTFSVLNLALEVLKTETEPITIPKLFDTATRILNFLPELKKRVDEVALRAAREAEKWVTAMGEEDNGQKVDQYVKYWTELSSEAEASNGVQQRLDENGPVEKEVPPSSNASDVFVDDTNSAEQPSPQTVTGTVQAISKNGKGVKIGDTWYNITSKTRKEIEPERGKKVKIIFLKGNVGPLINEILPA